MSHKTELDVFQTVVKRLTDRINRSAELIERIQVLNELVLWNISRERYSDATYILEKNHESLKEMIDELHEPV